jgi:hypothetical protein
LSLIAAAGVLAANEQTAGYGISADGAKISEDAENSKVLAAKSEVENRKKFFDSLEKMTEEERNAAMLKFRNEESARDALREKSPEEIAHLRKSDEELEAESDARRKELLRRQIALKEEEIAERKSASRNAVKAVASDSEKSISSKSVSPASSNVELKDSLLLELEELSLKRTRAELAADISHKKLGEFYSQWEKSADGRRMREINEALLEMEALEHIDSLKKSLAKLNAAELGRSGVDAAESAERARLIEVLSLQLSDAEFRLNLKNIPESEKDQAYKSHIENMEEQRNKVLETRLK